jgi:hypothetical protein
MEVGIGNNIQFFAALAKPSTGILIEVTSTFFERKAATRHQNKR